jgi:hypothetical protein
MEAVCHRCHTPLAAPDVFCPACGAPQLRFEPSGDQADLGSGSKPGYADTTGVAWKHAIAAAATVAVPMGVLTALPLVNLFFLLWIVGGAVLAVSLYSRRASASLLNAGTGARIGLIAGLIAALTATLITGLSLVAQRFLLHTGPLLDEELKQLAEQMTERMAQSPTTQQAQMQAIVHFLLSPDGKAVWMLSAAVMSAAGIVLFAVAGGALGARVFASRRRALGNS